VTRDGLLLLFLIKIKKIKKFTKFHKMTRDMYEDSVNVNLTAETKLNLFE